MKSIWITWEIQRRNKGIASALNWPLYEITFCGNRLKRYILSICETVRVVLSEKPEIIAVQNPSIILALVSIAIKHLFKVTLIIDSHNAGILPLNGQNCILQRLARFIQRKTDLTIVTNSGLKRIVEKNKGRAFVLPDKVPTAPPQSGMPLSGKKTIACISTFGEDEPYLEAIKSARLVGQEIYIYFTGKYQGKIDLENLPPNVVMLGYVSDDRYWAILRSVDVVMDLTTRKDCLICGAYEGVAVEKPLILSDTKAIRQYFNKGCVYVQNDSESIAKGIRTAFEKIDLLKIDVVTLKNKLEDEWKTTFLQFRDKLHSLHRQKRTIIANNYYTL